MNAPRASRLRTRGTVGPVGAGERSIQGRVTQIDGQRPDLTITPEAWVGLREAQILVHAPDPIVRLAVKGRDLDGFWYDMYFVGSVAVTQSDVQISGPGVTVLLDVKTKARLKGAVVDYVNQEFVVRNSKPTWSSEALAALVANECGLLGHSEDSKAAANNKYLMRQSLGQAGLLTPAFRRVSVGDDPRRIAAELVFPCVLKPLALSASCGVMRANDADEFVGRFEHVSRIMKRADVAGVLGELADYVLVESYIPGDEVVVEGLVSDGCLEVLAILDKPNLLEGPFFEETIYVRPSRHPEAVREEVVRTSRAIVDGLGLRDGPVHIEARLNEDGVWPLDIGARIMGGQCSRMLRFANGRSLEEIVVTHALGQRVARHELADRASGVMMIPTPQGGVLVGVDGVAEASGIPLVDDVCIAVPYGHRVEPPPEGMDYLGFIFAYGETPEEVTAALRQAHSCLTIRIAENNASVPLKIDGLQMQ